MGRIAVVGSGVAGLASSYYLSKDHDVDLFESEDRIGGHTHTVAVQDPTLGEISVDTGFIVFNEANYPHFIRMLSELDVAYIDSDMSFSFECQHRPFVWGSDFPQGIFAQRKNYFSPRFYKFILGIHRFNQRCLADFESGLPLSMSLGDYLETRGVSRDVVMDYVLPMTSAIWSASYQDSLRFPMSSFIRFWKNHQLLEIGKGLPWKTIRGGSAQYISPILSQISGRVRINTPVKLIRRTDDGVEIGTAEGLSQYDGVVIATHADTAFRLLEHPLAQEVALLSTWHYSKNQTILHTDSRFLPEKRAAWCSWNVRKSPAQFDQPASVTYWMNRLQSIKSTIPYLVTLNPESPIRDAHIIKKMTYTHPQMTEEAMGTQSELPELNRNSRIVFAGSYFGYGFHEDAVASAISAVDALGETLNER